MGKDMNESIEVKICSYCNFYKSSSNASLGKHQANCWANPDSKNPDATNWICHICSKRQMTSKDLKKHLKNYHSTAKKNTCKWCHYENEASEIAFNQNHLTKCANNPYNIEYTCDKCSNYKSTNLQALKQHKNKCNNIRKIWKCTICHITFNGKNERYLHNKELNHTMKDFKEATKTLQNCEYCLYSKITTDSGFSLHEKYCKNNPNAIKFIGRPHSGETKKKISENMKKLHSENIAHRWKNPHLYTSYPEGFFMKVIENEFTDKNYAKELPMGKYFLDFAWPHKMKAIEIDGSQHERFQHQRESDARKDALARELGWEILRIKWSDMYNDTKKFIKIAREFIEKNNTSTPPN